MKVIVFGATGMVGSEVHQAIKNPEITKVVAVVRVPLDFEHLIKNCYAYKLFGL